MGSVTIRTVPKGAQVAINQRVLDKLAPVRRHVESGKLHRDITLTGFKPVHKVVSVDKGGKTPSTRFSSGNTAEARTRRNS